MPKVSSHGGTVLGHLAGLLCWYDTPARFNGRGGRAPIFRHDPLVVCATHGSDCVSEDELGAHRVIHGQLSLAAAAAAAPPIEGRATEVERGAPLQSRPAGAHLAEHVVCKGPPRR